MKITETPLSGLLIIEPKVFADDRGYFFETFQANRYQEVGIPPFVQDNTSRSTQHVLRGLHYQLARAQGKLVWVTRGSIFDVALDIRLSSPTFGQWFSIILSSDCPTQLYIPPGFAHGFCVISDEADFHYKCTDYYSPENESGIIWNDANLNIPWPTVHPCLSAKDKNYPPLHKVAHERLYA